VPTRRVEGKKFKNVGRFLHGGLATFVIEPCRAQRSRQGLRNLTAIPASADERL
jgi:hypothetical protein